MGPEKILAKEAMAEPHRIVIGKENRENQLLEILAGTLKDLIRREASN